MMYAAFRDDMFVRSKAETRPGDRRFFGRFAGNAVLRPDGPARGDSSLSLAAPPTAFRYDSSSKVSALPAADAEEDEDFGERSRAADVDVDASYFRAFSFLLLSAAS